MKRLHVDNVEYEIVIAKRLEGQAIDKEKLAAMLERNTEAIAGLKEKEEFFISGEFAVTGYKDGNALVVDRVLPAENVF